jgi:hypothetical protein
MKGVFGVSLVNTTNGQLLSQIVGWLVHSDARRTKSLGDYRHGRKHKMNTSIENEYANARKEFEAIFEEEIKNARKILMKSHGKSKSTILEHGRVLDTICSEGQMSWSEIQVTVTDSVGRTAHVRECVKKCVDEHIVAIDSAMAAYRKEHPSAILNQKYLATIGYWSNGRAWIDCTTGA